MSLLLPEILRIGLCSGRSWLVSRAGKVEVAMAIVAGVDELLQALSALLDGSGGKAKRRVGVHLLLSDAIGKVIPLPWQEHLNGEGETLEYARACFERRGVVLGDDWTLHAGYRHFGAAGIAYALPRNCLELIDVKLNDYNARLRMAMPVSAAVYWYQPNGGRRNSRLIVLNEENRLTALLFGPQGLSEIDTQAIVEGRDQAARRLLRRLTARQMAVSEVILWSSALEDVSGAVFAECLPESVIFSDARSIWSNSWIN